MAGITQDVMIDDSVRVFTKDRLLFAVSARAIVALGILLSHCLTETESLELEPVHDPETNQSGWEASLDASTFAFGSTPWRAIQALAEEIRPHSLPLVKP